MICNLIFVSLSLIYNQIALILLFLFSIYYSVTLVVIRTNQSQIMGAEMQCLIAGRAV